MSVREGLLALLAEAPKHGYQLKQEFEATTAGIWPLNIGQVYTTLDRLERDGLVEPTGTEADGRKQYRLTDTGRVELEDWFSIPPDGAPQRDSLIIKVLVALHTAGVDPRDVIDTQRTALLTILQQHRRAQRKAVGALEGPALDAAPDDLSAVLLFDALVSRVESDLRWLDVCEQRLISYASSTADSTADATASSPAAAQGSNP
jgi:DNA-binding PadR family transcriptional regulator